MARRVKMEREIDRQQVDVPATRAALEAIALPAGPRRITLEVVIFLVDSPPVVALVTVKGEVWWPLNRLAPLELLPVRNVKILHFNGPLFLGWLA